MSVFSRVTDWNDCCVFQCFGRARTRIQCIPGNLSLLSLMKTKRRLFTATESSPEIHIYRKRVDANIKAAHARKGIGEVMNAANGERVTLNELLEVLKKIIGKPNVAADYQPERKGDVKHSQCSNARAVELIGYKKLVGLEEGLQKTIDWWKSSRFAK